MEKLRFRSLFSSLLQSLGQIVRSKHVSQESSTFKIATLNEHIYGISTTHKKVVTALYSKISSTTRKTAK